MTRTNKLIVTVLIVSIVWPPIFFLFVADHIRPTVLGRGEMRDYELQKLLRANRWVIEIPQNKDGWYLELVCKDGDKTYSSGGTSVTGGSTIVLLTRRNTFDDRIEYAWYQQATSTKKKHKDGPLAITLARLASGSGSVADPLANANVGNTRPDGKVSLGDCLYRGGKSSVRGYPSGAPADFEVRVELKPPTGNLAEQSR